MLAAVLEDEARAGDEVLDGGADEDLGGAGERGDPGADVHGDAADVGAQQLDLAGVAAGADLESQRTSAKPRIAAIVGRLALHVNDVAAARAALEEKGVNFFEPCTTSRVTEPSPRSW